MTIVRLATANISASVSYFFRHGSDVRTSLIAWVLSYPLTLLGFEGSFHSCCRRKISGADSVPFGRPTVLAPGQPMTQAANSLPCVRPQRMCCVGGYATIRNGLLSASHFPSLLARRPSTNMLALSLARLSLKQFHRMLQRWVPSHKKQQRKIIFARRAK